MRTAICTISSNNFLSYGLTCLYSAKKYNNCDLFYLISDDYKSSLYGKYDCDITFVNLSALQIRDSKLTEMKFKYNIVEFNTCVKPAFYLYLFSKGYDAVIYLDPDIEVYNSLSEIEDILSENSVVLTPHKIKPIENELLRDRAFLNNGIYNLGFIGMRNDSNTINFLRWWNDKLEEECYIEYKNGLATDQIWVELAPTIFDGFYITKHPGMNVAFWNFLERDMEYDNGKYSFDGKDLLFFHFSSLSVNCKKSLLDALKKINPIFEKFYEAHITTVRNYEFEKFSKESYAYNYFDNGKQIEPLYRKFYGYSDLVKETYKNPFSTKENCFLNFIEGKEKLKITAISRNSKLIKLMINILGIKRVIRLTQKISNFSIESLSKLYLIKNSD